jgi:L-fuconolactonase
MFESNFPTDRHWVSYGVLWNAFKRMTAGASESELDALFHNTAARVYRLT